MLPIDKRKVSTASYVRYAVSGGHLSVYKGNNCIYPRVLMHEVGHLLAFNHANDHGSAYGDGTSMMGFGGGGIFTLCCLKISTTLSKSYVPKPIRFGPHLEFQRKDYHFSLFDQP